MAVEQQPARSWWERNWKWAVPAGCVALVFLAAGTVNAFFSLMKSSGAYSGALELARSDCEVQARLGMPLRPGWSVSGSVSVAGPSGHAELSIPLRGSQRSGTLYATATKTAGQWHFELLQLAVAGQSSRVDVLAQGRKTCA